MGVDVPAVVLGAGINGLGVARSLGRAGVTVWLADADSRRPEMRTRVARPLALQAMGGPALVEDLVRIAASTFVGTRPVLYLTQEASVTTVSQQRARLEPLYRFTLPAQDVVATLQHKDGFQQVAERSGAPIPPLVHFRSELDLRRLRDLHFPVVVKPAARNEDYARRFKKAYRAETIDAATALLRQILPVMPDVVAQEWIEGPDANIYFCLQYLDAGGTVAASFTGRKIRSWPPQTGGTASCTAAPEAHPELSTLTERFFRNAGVVGMASMEYKRDARSGRFLMVEPTVGRTDYQEEIATLNGVNLPYAAWCVEAGVAVPQPVIATRPRAWRVRSEDVQSAAVQNQPLRRGFEDVANVSDALWRWSDPGPALAQNLRRLRRALASRAAKLLPRSRVVGEKS